MNRRAFLSTAAVLAGAPSRVLIVEGPSKHPPGTHEVGAGARLMQHCLAGMKNVSGVAADVVTAWPSDKTALDAVRTVVFIGDVFPPLRMAESERIMADLGAMMKRGCGIVCIHFATGLQAADLPPSGDHPLLHWMGGYFSTGGAKHHKSVARVFPSVTITPAAPAHPICRGWKAFTLPEEPYYNNYFGPDGNRMAAGVTALATAMLPPEAPKSEVVAWSVERGDGGRGFAVVMPHFYKTWKDDDFRRFALNGIVWSAKLAVPKGGVRTDAPDLMAFGPGALEPKAR